MKTSSKYQITYDKLKLIHERYENDIKELYEKDGCLDRQVREFIDKLLELNDKHKNIFK